MGLLGKIDRYKEAIDELRPFEGDLLSQNKAGQAVIPLRRQHKKAHFGPFLHIGGSSPHLQSDIVRIIMPL